MYCSVIPKLVIKTKSGWRIPKFGQVQLQTDLK